LQPIVDSLDRATDLALGVRETEEPRDFPRQSRLGQAAFMPETVSAHLVWWRGLPAANGGVGRGGGGDARDRIAVGPQPFLGERLGHFDEERGLRLETRSFLAQDAPEPLSVGRQVQGRLDGSVVLTERVDNVRLGVGRFAGATHLQIELQSGLNLRLALRGVHALVWPR
jgi:hypothetical protein